MRDIDFWDFFEVKISSPYARVYNAYAHFVYAFFFNFLKNEAVFLGVFKKKI